MVLSSRINGTTLSKKDEKESYIEYLDGKYNQVLEAVANQLNTTVKNYKSKCLPCTGAKIGILRS
jgi:putative heme iron utilization protein